MIRTRGLTKRYGRALFALDGLDMDVPTGAIYGFIGQNGSGKTTTIRTLATLLVPDARRGRGRRHRRAAAIRRKRERGSATCPTSSASTTI